MAVAAAHQHDVAQNGAGGLHQRPASNSRTSSCSAARSASGVQRVVRMFEIISQQELERLQQTSAPKS